MPITRLDDTAKDVVVKNSLNRGRYVFLQLIDKDLFMIDRTTDPNDLRAIQTAFRRYMDGIRKKQGGETVDG